jgi:hypothetical protein
VPVGKRLELQLSEVRPGYVHTKVFEPGRTNKYEPPESESGGSFTREQNEFLAGRELWLIKSATCVRDSDPLGLASKKIVAASNVKLNSLSYSAVPLSESEASFALPDVDCDYSVELKLYEVDGLLYKRALARLEPGLLGIFKSAWSTLTSIFKSIVGPSLFDTDAEGTLLLEQLLLSLNAKLEFHGQIYVRRLHTTTDSLPSNYLLYDAVKSDFARTVHCASTQFSADGAKLYREAMESIVTNCGDLDLLTTESRYYTYIRFTLRELAAP